MLFELLLQNLQEKIFICDPTEQNSLTAQWSGCDDTSFIFYKYALQEIIPSYSWLCINWESSRANLQFTIYKESKMFKNMLFFLLLFFFFSLSFAHPDSRFDMLLIYYSLLLLQWYWLDKTWFTGIVDTYKNYLFESLIFLSLLKLFSILTLDVIAVVTWLSSQLNSNLSMAGRLVIFLLSPSPILITHIFLHRQFRGVVIMDGLGWTFTGTGMITSMVLVSTIRNFGLEMSRSWQSPKCSQRK